MYKHLKWKQGFTMNCKLLSSSRQGLVHSFTVPLITDTSDTVVLMSYDSTFNGLFPFLPPGPDLRAGTGTWRNQEHQKRHPPQWQRHPRPRQIQDPTTDPTGQHQAEDRRVRGLIKKKIKNKPSPPSQPPFLIGLYTPLLCWHINCITTQRAVYAQQKHRFANKSHWCCECVWRCAELCRSFNETLVPKPFSS